MTPSRSAIIERGVEELALMVATVARKLDFVGSMKSVPVVVTGGLTNARGVFMDPLPKRDPATGFRRPR